MPSQLKAQADAAWVLHLSGSARNSSHTPASSPDNHQRTHITVTGLSASICELDLGIESAAFEGAQCNWQ
jgi:hypothetical protein